MSERAAIYLRVSTELPHRSGLLQLRPVVLGVVFALAIGFAGCDSSGSSGIEPKVRDGAIVIRSFAELRQIKQNEDFPLDGDYVLADDINASTVGAQDSTGQFRPIGQDGEPFTGRFDGKGHTISGLTLSARTSGTDTLGLFGYAKDAVIQNLRLEDVSIRGGRPVGMLVGLNQFSDIRDIQVSGRIASARRAGGVVGRNEGGTVENAEAQGTIQESSRGVGGLVGLNNGGTVRSSKSGVDLSGVQNRVGGLVGFNGALTSNGATGPGTISGSVAKGDVVTGDVASNGVGGLVGVNNAQVEDSRATGAVIATGTYAGGLAAINDGVIRGSSAHGDVKGKEVEPSRPVAAVGGLVALNSQGRVLQCSASGDVTLETVTSKLANSFIGGLVAFMSSGAAHVAESKATGSVSATGALRVNAGGLVGTIFGGSVSKSYTTGRVGGVAAENAGGLVGKMTGGSIRRSFAAGTAVLAAEHEGGVTGENIENGSASLLFWDMEQTNQGNAVGNGKEIEATGLTTDEMQGESARENMQGLNFEETWQVVDGDYPALFWEDIQR